MTLDDKLLHYGVKGMKWGVTKQKKSKSTTDAESRLKDAKANKKESGSISKILTKDFSKNKKLSQLDVQYAKEDLSSSKILDKLNSKPKSDRQLKHEVKYKNKGLTDDEAAVAAYKNIRTKNALTAIAATAVTVGAISAGYKISEEYLDKTIKSGTKLQNISSDSDMGVRDAFYSSRNSLDKIKYKGLFGRAISKREEGTGFLKRRATPHVKDIEVISDIKRASASNARKTLKEMIDKDPKYKKFVADHMREQVLDSRYKDYKEAASKLDKGIVDKKVYDRFNTMLVDHSRDGNIISGQFYENMSKKGYNAIRDVNDTKFSGYKALEPLITFKSDGKVKVVDVKELAKKEIDKNENIAMGSLFIKPLAAQGAVITSATLAGKQAPKIALRRRVDAYRQENPGTKLTNTEISRMLERNEYNV